MGFLQVLPNGRKEEYLSYEDILKKYPLSKKTLSEWVMDKKVAAVYRKADVEECWGNLEDKDKEKEAKQVEEEKKEEEDKKKGDDSGNSNST